MHLCQLQSILKDILLQKPLQKEHEHFCQLHDLKRLMAPYQQSMYMGLYNNLLRKFSMTHLLLGDSRFFETAKEYILTSPPTSPYLCEYGSDLASLVSDALIKQMAELEWLMHVSLVRYQRVDPTPLSPDQGKIRVVLHPFVQLYRSSYPLKDIWMCIKNKKDIPEAPQNSCFLISVDEHKRSFFMAITESESAVLERFQNEDVLYSAQHIETLQKFQNYLVIKK